MPILRYSSNKGKPIVCSLLLTCLTPVAIASDLAVRIAATVNDGVVLVTEVEKKTALFRSEQRAQGRLIPFTPELYDLTLNALIDRKLQLQRADSLRVEIADEQVENVILNLVNQRGQGLEKFFVEIGLEPAEFFAEVRDDLRISEAFRRDNNEKLAVSSQQVDQVLRNHLGSERQREYLLEHAIFAEGQRSVAEKLSSTSSDLFATYATEAQNADQLSMGWVHEAKLPTAYKSAMVDLASGEVSPVLDLPNGLHVLHLVAIRPVVPGRVGEKRIKLRLLKVASDVDDGRLRDTVVQLKGRSLSMEQAQQELGGELSDDLIETTNLPAQMQRQLKLRPGVLDGPFRYEDGKVLVQVIEVQEYVDNADLLRQQAQQIALDESYQKLQREWIENLRSIARIVIIRGSS